MSKEVGYNLRLIPACAGKTGDDCEAGDRRGAHPRVCGENAALDRSPKALQGSSPRVRGKLNNGLIGDRLEGLIPACAGKTRCGDLA